MAPVTRFYTIRKQPHGPWARIWITDDGCFTTISDHGNFGYWWGSPGQEFRKFLCSCDDYYIISKLSGGQEEFDGDATKKVINERLKELHRDGEDTRAESELLGESEFDDPVGFARWVDAKTDDGERLIDYYERCSIAVYRPPVRVQMFVKHLWPLFVEALKDELAGEAVSVEAAAHSAS